MSLSKLRKEYHKSICREIFRIIIKQGGNSYPNNADGSNSASRKIAWAILESLGCNPQGKTISGQTVGNKFELITKDFLEKSLGVLQHIRPGKWVYSINQAISNYDQYSDLAKIEEVVKMNRELATTLGKDYVVSPDIVIAREPLSDKEINRKRRPTGNA